MHHTLKLDKKYWHSVASGTKPFEVRLNDRNYKQGDTITFIDSYSHCLLMPNMVFRITYILKHSEFKEGIQDGYCLFAIAPIEEV